jgi:hypothetical protein
MGKPNILRRYRLLSPDVNKAYYQSGCRPEGQNDHIGAREQHKHDTLNKSKESSVTNLSIDVENKHEIVEKVDFQLVIVVNSANRYNASKRI